MLYAEVDNCGDTILYFIIIVYIMGLSLVSRYLLVNIVYPVIRFQKLRAHFCPYLITGSIIYVRYNRLSRT